jgi:hypothetical protein
MQSSSLSTSVFHFESSGCLQEPCMRLRPETRPPSPPHHRVSSSIKASQISNTSASSSLTATAQSTAIPTTEFPQTPHRLDKTIMAEPSPIPAHQTTDSDSTPIPNGAPVAADIEMADSVPMQEVCLPVHHVELL